MIEVSAKLVRGPVYITGETIECCITFRNPVTDIHVKAQSNSDVCETLAWASAQIHCQCSVNEAKVVYPESGTVTPEERATSNTASHEGRRVCHNDVTEGIYTSDATSFAPCRGERGHIVLSTKPKILFCDLRLLPGESKSYLYREVLPNEAPPSYRGQAVKYGYKITIGTQRVNSAIKLLRMPLRLMVLDGLVEASLCGESEDVAPSNPFLENQQKETTLDLALQVIQNVTARRSPNYYNITNSQGKVVRFCLFKPAYKLGEDIVGTFDFSDAVIPCVQFAVTLQSEEVIAESCRRRNNQGPSVVSYNKYHEMCLSMQHTQMILPIPLHITPAFTTDVVSLRWKLHFEFVTSVSTLKMQPTPDDQTIGEAWQGPQKLNIETMIWDLPIKVYPTSPIHVSQGLQVQSEYSMLDVESVGIHQL